MSELNTNERIKLDNLNPESVSVVKETFVLINGIETRVGMIERNAFMNNTYDKERLRNYLGENSPYYITIINLWENYAEVGNEEMPEINNNNNSNSNNSSNNELTNTDIELAIAEVYEENEKNNEDIMLALVEIYESL